MAWNSVARDSMFYNPFDGSDSTVTWLQSPVGEKRFRIYHSNNPDLATPDTTNITSNTSITFPQRYYNWDATTGVLSSFAFAGQPALAMTYTAEQLRTGTTFPSSSGTRTESRTSLHGVIQSQFSAGNLQSNLYRAYQYDDIGRVKAWLDGPNGSTRWTYTYDNLGRLSGAVAEYFCTVLSENLDFGVTSSCDQPQIGPVFSYDQVGNRTDLGGTVGTGNRIQSFNGITFSHDADGNVTQKYKAGVYDRKYWWSAEARLDSAQQDNWSKVRYDYDALGRPVRKWRGDPNGWVFDRLWVYDGDHRVVSLDPSMNRIEEYAYAPGIDQPIATIRGNTGVDAVGYHVQDELGNILGIIENGAYISQTNSYDAWGTPTETGHAYNNQLKWKGLKWEGDVISLYYMRNRWYDYETGRFMSEDPVGLAGGINLYAFANNDPVNGWDPYGLCPPSPCILPPVVITGRRGWPFSTPRDQGWSNNFGKRGGGWWNDSGYGDENWNGGNGPSGAEALEAIKQIARRTKPLKTVVECTAATAIAGSAVASWAPVLRSGGRAVAYGASAVWATRQATRYTARSVVPGSFYRTMAVAADATAVHSYASASAAGGATVTGTVTALVQGAQIDVALGGSGSLRSILFGDFERVAATCK